MARQGRDDLTPGGGTTNGFRAPGIARQARHRVASGAVVGRGRLNACRSLAKPSRFYPRETVWPRPTEGAARTAKGLDLRLPRASLAQPEMRVADSKVSAKREGFQDKTARELCAADQHALATKRKAIFTYQKRFAANLQHSK